MKNHDISPKMFSCIPDDIISYLFSFPANIKLSQTSKKIYELSKKSYNHLLKTHYQIIVHDNILNIPVKVTYYYIIYIVINLTFI